MDKETKLEEEILAFFERGEWQSVPQLKSEITRYTSIASASLANDNRVNIRVPSHDLKDIQAKTVEVGDSYQTLMHNVLPKFVTGRHAEPASVRTPRSTRAFRKKKPGEL